MMERIDYSSTTGVEMTVINTEAFHALANMHKEAIVDQLIRLDTVTHGKSLLDPEQRLNIALEVSEIGIGRVAKKYSFHHAVAERAVRDTAAALTFISGARLDGQENSKRIKQLTNINEELSTTASVVKQPEIKKELKQIPHVKELFDDYFRWRTVKPRLDYLEIPYNDYQLRSVGRYLRENTVEDSLDGLKQLARRFVLSKWLHGTDPRLDARISKAAEFILTEDCSELPERMPDRMRSMRQFLIKSMDSEYASLGKSIYRTTEDLELFPEKYDGEIEMVIEAYKLFGEAGYCPLMLKKYAKQAVNEVAPIKRISLLGSTDFYSDSWLENIDWAGLKFLEDTLMHRGATLNWSMFMIDTGEVLKRAKQKMLTM